MSGAPAGFLPGEGVGIVTERALVLIERPLADVATDLEAALDAGGGIDDVLDVLASAGLRAIGAFAVAFEEGDALRVVVRGSAEARVVGGGASVRIDGNGLRTWNEQLVAEWQQVALGFGDARPEPSIFRVDRGVVPAASLERPVTARATVRAFDQPDARWSAPAPPETEPDVAPVPQLLTPPPEQPAQPSAPAPMPADTIHPHAFDETMGPDARQAFVSMPPPNAFDQLFGQTVDRNVHDAAIHLDDADGHGVAGAVQDLGDHDGNTVSLAQLREMQRAEATARPAPAADPEHHTISAAPQLGDVATAPDRLANPGGAMVQALLCAGGHPNPTHTGSCRRCGCVLDGQPVTIPRPTLGRLVLSTGDVIELDRPVIIGRKPKVEGRLEGELPKVVRLDAYSGLSRSHAMVRLEGWQVLLVDLGSQNHTTVTLPGRTPLSLRADEPLLLVDGAFVDFAGEVTATYEDRG